MIDRLIDKAIFFFTEWKRKRGLAEWRHLNRNNDIRKDFDD